MLETTAVRQSGHGAARRRFYRRLCLLLALVAHFAAIGAYVVIAWIIAFLTGLGLRMGPPPVPPKPPEPPAEIDVLPYVATDPAEEEEIERRFTRIESDASRRARQREPLEPDLPVDAPAEKSPAETLLSAPDGSPGSAEASVPVETATPVPQVPLPSATMAAREQEDRDTEARQRPTTPGPPAPESPDAALLAQTPPDAPPTPPEPSEPRPAEPPDPEPLRPTAPIPEPSARPVEEPAPEPDPAAVRPVETPSRMEPEPFSPEPAPVPRDTQLPVVPDPTPPPPPPERREAEPEPPAPAPTPPPELARVELPSPIPGQPEPVTRPSPATVRSLETDAGASAPPPRPPQPMPTIKRIGRGSAEPDGMPRPDNRRSRAALAGDEAVFAALRAKYPEYMRACEKKLREAMVAESIANPTPYQPGIIRLRFAIEADGSVTNVEVTREPEGMMSERILSQRVLTLAAPFDPLTPAMQQDPLFRQIGLAVHFY